MSGRHNRSFKKDNLLNRYFVILDPKTLKESREELGVSLSEMARRCDVDKSVISRIEKGVYVYPSTEYLLYSAYINDAFGNKFTKKQDESLVNVKAELERIMDSLNDLYSYVNSIIPMEVKDE